MFANNLSIGGNVKKLIKNIISLSVIKVIDLVIPLIILPYLIVTVGASNYGIYAFSYTLVFYFLNITQYGFSLSAVKKIALIRENKEELNDYFNEIMSTKLLLTLISYAVIILLCLIVPKFSENYFVVLTVSLMLLGDSLTPTWYFQGIEKMQFITYVNIVSKLLFLLSVYLLITEDKDYIYIGLFQSISFLLAGILSLLYISKVHKLSISFVKFKNFSKNLKDGFVSFLTLAVPTLYSNTSVFILGLFAPYQSVTFLEVGTKISSMFSVLSSIISRALYPFLNRNIERTKLALIVQVSLGAIASVMMYFGGEIILNLWMKKSNNAEIVEIVNILSLSPFLLSVIYAFGVNGLLVKNEQREFLKATVISSVIGLLLAIILIPQGDYKTAALTIILARAFYAMFTYIFYKRRIRNVK